MKYISTQYSGKINRSITITLLEESIKEISDAGEHKVNNTEIEQINEIADYYFLRLKTGVSVIIPKVMVNQNDILLVLKRISQRYGIKFNNELDWKWN